MKLFDRKEHRINSVPLAVQLIDEKEENEFRFICDHWVQSQTGGIAYFDIVGAAFALQEDSNKCPFIMCALTDARGTYEGACVFSGFKVAGVWPIPESFFEAWLYGTEVGDDV
jgi:hypothetical protein